MSNYQRFSSKQGVRLNAKIMSGFLCHYQNINIRKTHLFEGRYENIYLTVQHIPALKSILDEASDHAKNILQLTNLQTGFWFYFMPPGAIILAHRHNVDDELLSADYYVDIPAHIPAHSGNLIIYNESDSTGHGKDKVEISPVAGEFIFFDAGVRHKVTKNCSNKARLSIVFNFGTFNFGPAKD